MGRERSSNIELLRILSMFLICLHHFCVHGPWWSISAGMASSEVLTVLSLGGKLGVDLFVLISGYFLVTSRFKVRSLARVLLATLFYSVTIAAVFAVASPSSLEGVNLFVLPMPTAVDLGNAQWPLFPTLSKSYWFITAYVGLYVLSPVLNRLVAPMSLHTLSKLGVMGFVLLSVIPTVTGFSFVLSDFVWFCFLYVLGATLRRTKEGLVAQEEEPLGRWCVACNPVALVRTCGPARCIVLSVAFIVASSAALYLASTFIDGYSADVHYFMNMYSIPMVVLAVGVFVAFEGLDVPHSALVNTVAASTFGVYLIHDNFLVRSVLWDSFAWTYTRNFVLVAVLAVAVAAAVYLVCTLVDIVRVRFIEKPLFAVLDKRLGTAFERFDNAVNAVQNE